jgi:hypothetical protein
VAANLTQTQVATLFNGVDLSSIHANNTRFNPLLAGRLLFVTLSARSPLAKVLLATLTSPIVAVGSPFAFPLPGAASWSVASPACGPLRKVL